ncbi:hypothetical protein GCM10010297_49860 [Streptomyces malachitofuscus]|nr:hypothetical protein GCM10010297_49860 [Streptomyces malachitofuscus]
MTTHARPGALNPRSLWIAGMATVTMVPSRIVISVPAHSTTRDARREYVRRRATGAGDSVVVDMG